jgi:hypothetical protein
MRWPRSLAGRRSSIALAPEASNISSVETSNAAGVRRAGDARRHQVVVWWRERERHIRNNRKRWSRGERNEEWDLTSGSHGQFDLYAFDMKSGF